MVSANNAQGGSRFCANCGTPLEADSQFCGNCGQPGGVQVPAAGWTAPVAAQANAGWVPPGTPPPGVPLFAPPMAPARPGGSGRCLIIAGVAALGLLLLLCCGGLGIYWLSQAATPTPTASPSPLRPTSTPTAAPAAPATATVAAATATPTALPGTATPVPTATATAAPKPSATATRAPTPSVLFMDDFSSRQTTLDNGWNLDSSTNVDYTWSPGKLTIAIKKANWVGSTWPYTDYLDFAAEGEAQPVGTDYAEYGMVFRVSGQSGTRTYYAFGLRSDGKYYLYQYVAGAWMDKDAVAPTASSQIKQGPAKNTFGVIVQGNKISLLINRVLVNTVTDDSIKAAGRVGFIAGTGASNANCSVAFTKLTILTVQKAKADWGVP